MRRCEVRWLVSSSASCLHAADAIVRGWRLVERRIEEALTPPALALQDEIRSAGLPEERFWRNLTSLAHQFENNRQLAMLAVRKTTGGAFQDESTWSQIAGRIGDLESAAHRVMPRMVEELTLRARPIRENWEAVGPGLLRRMGTLTDERLIVENADVVLVQPVLGGGGTAHLLNNSVRLEAVLTNTDAQLPEVLRLAWLVGQLHQDLPMFSEQVPSDHLPELAGLAMLPAALQAGHELELCPFDTPAIAHAIAAWRVDGAGDSTAGTVALWWQTCQSTETPWSIALSALHQMLHA